MTICGYSISRYSESPARSNAYAPATSLLHSAEVRQNYCQTKPHSFNPRRLSALAALYGTCAPPLGEHIGNVIRFPPCGALHIIRHQPITRTGLFRDVVPSLYIGCLLSTHPQGARNKDDHRQHQYLLHALAHHLLTFTPPGYDPDSRCAANVNSVDGRLLVRWGHKTRRL